MNGEKRWKRGLVRCSFLGAVLFGGLGICLAGNEPVRVWKPAKYVGAKKCKSCHSKEQSGHQFQAWEASKHSQAFAVLLTPEALAAGAERGVETPSEDDRCIKCHTTAFGVPAERLSKKFDRKNVQCEACHGPGGNHVKARLVAAADDEDEDDPFAEPGGPAYVEIPEAEIIKQPKLDTCLGCHNDESPSFKPFCFHERLSEIRHLNPLKPRTQQELDAFAVCSCEATCVCKQDSPDATCRSRGGALEGTEEDG